MIAKQVGRIAVQVQEGASYSVNKNTPIGGISFNSGDSYTRVTFEELYDLRYMIERVMTQEIAEQADRMARL